MFHIGEMMLLVVKTSSRGGKQCFQGKKCEQGSECPVPDNKNDSLASPGLFSGFAGRFFHCIAGISGSVALFLCPGRSDVWFPEDASSSSAAHLSLLDLSPALHPRQHNGNGFGTFCAPVPTQEVLNVPKRVVLRHMLDRPGDDSPGTSMSACFEKFRQTRALGYWGRRQFGFR